MLWCVQRSHLQRWRHRREKRVGEVVAMCTTTLRFRLSDDKFDRHVLFDLIDGSPVAISEFVYFERVSNRPVFAMIWRCQFDNRNA